MTQMRNLILAWFLLWTVAGLKGGGPASAGPFKTNADCFKAWQQVQKNWPSATGICVSDGYE